MIFWRLSFQIFRIGHREVPVVFSCQNPNHQDHQRAQEHGCVPAGYRKEIDIGDCACNGRAGIDMLSEDNGGLTQQNVT